MQDETATDKADISFLEMKALAEAGDTNAAANLARAYLIGSGVEKDYKSANKWALEAADSNHGLAQWVLGEMYYWGLGVNKDLDTAFDWFNKSAVNNIAKSQVGCGFILLCNVIVRGRYLKKDFPMKGNRMGAYYWFSVASLSGLLPKRVILGKWISRLFVSSKEAASIRARIKKQGVRDLARLRGCMLAIRI